MADGNIAAFDRMREREHWQQWIACLIGFTLARLLLQWSGEGRTSGGVVRMKLALTHEELAQLIGSSRETVTRILGDFKRRGVVELHGATMLILDQGALESLCMA